MDFYNLSPPPSMGRPLTSDSFTMRRLRGFDLPSNVLGLLDHQAMVREARLLPLEINTVNALQRKDLSLPPDMEGLHPLSTYFKPARFSGDVTSQ